jgi:hypothetical protein
MDYAQAPAVATLSLLDTHAKIIPAADEYVLWWTDRAVNEWTETHPSLGTALARLAVLEHAIAHNTGFTHPEPIDFIAPAAAFLTAAIAR